MMTPRLTRRSAMISAAGSLAAPALLAAAPAAAAPALPPAIPTWRRLKLGDFTVTTLLAATRLVENPHGTFGLNVSAEDFAALAKDSFIPADRSLNFFTPVLIETGTETVLFDTGFSPEDIVAALAAAGKTPDEITTVIISHMHVDHIGGLYGTAPTFPKARLITGQIEFDYWSRATNANFEAKIRPIARQFVQIADGDSPIPGMTAILAPGHTPGHMVWMIESAGRRLMLTADTANHYVWSIGRPEWQVRFDMDKPTATATRKRILSQIAQERLPFIGYHMPFPGIGYLETTGPGFRFVPASYQFDL